MYHKPKYRRTDQPRMIHLSDGRGILLHRLSNTVMGMCGPVDEWDVISLLTHYRYYVLSTDASGGQTHVTRKIREARR